MAKNTEIMSALQMIMTRLDAQDAKIAAYSGIVPTDQTDQTDQKSGTVATPEPLTGTVAEIGKSGYGIRLEGMDRWLTIGKGKHDEIGPIFKDVVVGDTVRVTRRTTHRAIACTVLIGAAKADAPKVTAKADAPKVTTPKATVETVTHPNGMCAFCQNQTKGGNPHSNDKAAGLECAVRQWTLSNGQGSFYADMLNGATLDAFYAWTLTVRPLKIWAPNKNGWKYAFEDASASSPQTAPAARETVKAAPVARETVKTTPAFKTVDLGSRGVRRVCDAPDCRTMVKMAGVGLCPKHQPTTPPSGKGKGSRKATQSTVTTVATTAQESTVALAPTVASELTWEEKLAAVKHPTKGRFRVTFVKSCDNPEKSDKDRSRPLIKVHSPEFTGRPDQDEPGSWLRGNDIPVYQKMIGKPRYSVWDIDIDTFPGKSGGPVTYILAAKQCRTAPTPDTAGTKKSGKNQPPVPARKRQDDKPAEKRAALRTAGKGTAGQISTARLADVCPKCSRRFSMVGRDASGLLCKVCAATA